ncbi:MAG TPA: BON domain-containing protein [Stellaceae bacterium]|nr:BON domain-containing protein [Stellaceae bacterium]
MTRSSFTLALVSTLALTPLLGGCAVAVVGGVAAAGGAGYEAGQERGIGGTIDDLSVTSQVNNQLNGQYGHISATVYQGRVLLTGTSPNPAAKAGAEQVASRVAGVKAVYNEIQVGPGEDAWQVANDAWITARVRSDLVFDSQIRSPNYTIETDRQSVYLIGSARSQAELDRATQIARYVPGVQRVVSYVEIRSGVPGGAQPGPSQAGMPAPPVASAPPTAPAPSASIQVQKL